MHRLALFLLTLLILPALSGCAPDTPSPTEREPDPKAAHTQLRDAIAEPQDRARAAADTIEAAARTQREQIDAAN